jgi:hypothetical protein
VEGIISLEARDEVDRVLTAGIVLHLDRYGIEQYVLNGQGFQQGSKALYVVSCRTAAQVRVHDISDRGIHSWT